MHLLVAAYLQYKPPEPAIRVQDAAELGPILASIPHIQAPALDSSAWAERTLAP